MTGSRESASGQFKKPNWLYILPVLLFAALALFTPIGEAQQLTGTISGTALDQTGAVIPHAKVVLKNEASGDSRDATTDNNGFFTITAVQPATYTITVSAKGFTTWQETSISVGEGATLSIANISLKVGGKPEDIEVVSGADAVVPVDTGEVSSSLNEQMINDLPITGRDAGELMKMMPGMALTNGLSQGSSFNAKAVGSNSGPVGAYSSNGTQPNGAMAFMLDGANLVDPGNMGTQIANINPDMVSEVKMLMSSYGAEYAKGPSIFEAFSKSGGQKFHGEGYMYARNSALNDIDWNLKHQGETSNAAEHYYYMGGNVGGPVILPFTKFNKNRNKLFFWGGYEYMNQKPIPTGPSGATGAATYNVPTVAQLAGDFSNTGVPAGAINQFPAAYGALNSNANAGSVSGVTSTYLPPSDFDPTAVAEEKFFPKPNVTPTANLGWNNFEYLIAEPQNRWEGTGKIDYALSDNTKITGSYSRQDETDQHPFAIWWAAPYTLPYPSNVVANEVSQDILSNVTHVFNATTTNEFVFTLARFLNPSKLANEAAVDRNKTGLGGIQGLFGHTTAQIPNIEGQWDGAFPWVDEYSFDGAFNGGGTFGGLKNDYALYDNFTKVYGTHSLKFGAYWDDNGNTQGSSAADNGTFSYSSWGGTGGDNDVSAFLLGRPTGYSQISQVPTDFLQFHQWSIYGQDSWKANKQLTLNFGIRFDHLGQWYGSPYGGVAFPGIQVWDPASYSNSQNAPSNTGLKWHSIDSSIPVSGFPSATGFFQPRLGFAYDIFGTGKTVLRGGFAVFRYPLSTAVCNNNTCDGPRGAVTASGGPYTDTIPLSQYIQTITPPSSVSQSGYTLCGGYTNNCTTTTGAVGGLQQGDNRTPSTMDWNITISQALPYRSVFEISYIGNKSSDEFINGTNGHYDDINAILPGGLFLPDKVFGLQTSPSAPSCAYQAFPQTTAACLTGPNGLPYPNYDQQNYRPLINYGDFFLMTHGSYANYNSLQTSFQKQSGVVTYFVNYTFSKVLGIWDGDTSNGAGNGSTVDPFNLKNNYGPLAYDHTQIFNASYVWNLPKPIHGNPLLAETINGWKLSGWTQVQSGAPLQPNLNGSLNAEYAGDLPNSQLITLPNGYKANAISPSTWLGTPTINYLLPQVICNPGAHLKSGQYFNPACFAPPAQGSQGTLHWPYLRGPAYVTSDLALFKNFRVTDSQHAEFRVSGSNFLNHPVAQFGSNNDTDLQFYISNPDGSGTQLPEQTNQNQATTGTPSIKVGARTLLFSVKYFF